MTAILDENGNPFASIREDSRSIESMTNSISKLLADDLRLDSVSTSFDKYLEQQKIFDLRKSCGVTDPNLIGAVITIRRPSRYTPNA